jgi:hypothetical protein
MAQSSPRLGSNPACEPDSTSICNWFNDLPLPIGAETRRRFAEIFVNSMTQKSKASVLRPMTSVKAECDRRRGLARHHDGGGLVGGEECWRRHRSVRLAEALHRNLLKQRLAEFLNSGFGKSLAK